MPLYVLTAETLAINIRANSKIHGLLPPGPKDVQVQLTQFASSIGRMDRSILFIHTNRFRFFNEMHFT